LPALTAATIAAATIAATPFAAAPFSTASSAPAAVASAVVVTSSLAAAAPLQQGREREVRQVEHQRAGWARGLQRRTEQHARAGHRQQRRPGRLGVQRN